MLSACVIDAMGIMDEGSVLIAMSVQKDLLKRS